MGHRFFLVGVTGPENMAPAWCVRTTATDDEATCRWTTVSVQMLIGVDFDETEFEPELKRRKVIGKTTAAAKTKAKKQKVIEDAVVETKVAIPLLVNVVPLQDGEELMWYRAKTEKRERAPTPITMGALAKQVRTARAAPAAEASGAAAAAAAF